MHFIFIHLLFVLILIAISESNECIHRDFHHGSTVCECNATYCDTIDPVSPLSKGQYVIYTSNIEGFRFHKTTGIFSNKHQSAHIEINSAVKYQQIYGWGGTFSDSATYLIRQLNNGTRNNLLRSLFSKEGIEYSLCRVPIGNTDFSLRYYSYDEKKYDINLTEFNLTKEDYFYKIPVIKEAMSLSNNTLKLFATAWTAPTWMKTSKKAKGYLKPEYYQTWADYHIKFLDAYRRENLSFWGITTGHQPMSSALLDIIPFLILPNMAWTPWDQSKWISQNFGPTLRKNSNYSNIKIISVDDQRSSLPLWMILMDQKARNYIDGIGFHWYVPLWNKPAFVFTKLLYPDKFLLNTEACTGDFTYKKKVLLGNWRRGEKYVEDIMEDMENEVTGWLDWNLALNEKGGPSYIKNYVESSIIINTHTQNFYKQPLYYAMGHFSKFVPPNSYKIESTSHKKFVKHVAFIRPDNGVAIIIKNRHVNDQNVTIYDAKRGFITVKISKRSINTLLYW